MTGIFEILESPVTQWYQDVAPSQEFFFFFFIVTSIVHATHTAWHTIGYRYADARFTMSLCVVTFSNQNSLSSSETSVNACLHKLHLLDARSLQPFYRFDKFKPTLKRHIFKSFSEPNGSFLGMWRSGFSERGSQYLCNGTNIAS
jgi:hypothetical protein